VDQVGRKIRYCDAREQVQDAFMHLAQRLLDRAGIMLIAVFAVMEALGEQDRAVDGADHFERIDGPRVAC
jgi:hypothetical protein